MKRDVHFVGFRGDEYRSAVKVWGKPDFFHRVFDDRVIFGGEVGDDDIIIFANGADKNTVSSLSTIVRCFKMSFDARGNRIPTLGFKLNRLLWKFSPKLGLAFLNWKIDRMKV